MAYSQESKKLLKIGKEVWFLFQGMAEGCSSHGHAGVAVLGGKPLGLSWARGETVSPGRPCAGMGVWGQSCSWERGTRAHVWVAGEPVTPFLPVSGVAGLCLPGGESWQGGSVRFAGAGCVRLIPGRRPRCRAGPPRSGPLSTLTSLRSYLLCFPFHGQGLYLISMLSSSVSLLLC